MLAGSQTTLRTWCMLFRHEICTILFITGIWGWKWGWTKLNLVLLESSWGGVNRNQIMISITGFITFCLHTKLCHDIASLFDFMLFNLDINIGVYITCFLCFVVQCTKRELTNAWCFIAVFVLLLPKLSLFWPQSSNYLLYNLCFKFYKKDPTSGGWGDGNWASHTS